MHLEPELENVLSGNPALRLLLGGRYRWAGLAIVLAVGYFLLGAMIATLDQALIAFLQSRFVYVLLIAVVACVTAAGWYPAALIQVIAVTPQSFK